MNCVVIDSNRDSLYANNEITFLNINCSHGLRTKFTVTNTKGDVVYKCKLNPFRRDTHQITDANGKTVVKFRLDMNDTFDSFNLHINSKNDNIEKGGNFNKNDYMNAIVQLYDEEYDSQRYQIKYYNKATGNIDTLELVDRSYYKNNIVVFDYKIYDGMQDYNAPLICDVGQSYSFIAKSWASIEPGVEPLFMVILHLCVFILNSYKITNKTGYLNSSVVVNSEIALASFH